MLFPPLLSYPVLTWLGSLGGNPTEASTPVSRIEQDRIPYEKKKDWNVCYMPGDAVTVVELVIIEQGVSKEYCKFSLKGGYVVQFSNLWGK